eukprot:1362080-Amorphochlora_amoeboformis.AAC.1
MEHLRVRRLRSGMHKSELSYQRAQSCRGKRRRLDLLEKCFVPQLFVKDDPITPAVMSEVFVAEDGSIHWQNGRRPKMLSTLDTKNHIDAGKSGHDSENRNDEKDSAQQGLI